MNSTGGLSSNFNMYVTNAGAVMTGVFAALVNLTGQFIAQTADRSADAALVANGALWSPPWINPPNVPVGDLYGAILIATATTLPLFRCFAASDPATCNLGRTAAAGNLEVASGPAGLSVLPANVNMATLGLSARSLWMAAT